MPHTREAALASLQTEFLFDSDLARLLALNTMIEAPRMGEEGETARPAVTPAARLGLQRGSRQAAA